MWLPEGAISDFAGVGVRARSCCCHRSGVSRRICSTSAPQAVPNWFLPAGGAIDQPDNLARLELPEPWAAPLAVYGLLVLHSLVFLIFLAHLLGPG